MSSKRICTACSVPLIADDVAIYLKLVSRTAQQFLCIDCLGVKLNCGREPIDKLIQYYRESGKCSLFR
ncbi:hypothetical protein J40TS1_51050 [Paenibacillus montaniterrae]|uniref:Uncharacterized protein n=1 Tax=Paenibacillus montaniterrae TaxID=429341 RepID=A0A920D1C9_9BACL|nr:hypothetical protein [Paenibacillus montaniterrae]GIP19463.1 hypothetical protein J40TS1_51050 [Paenibacillus montaniterrae]